MVFAGLWRATRALRGRFARRSASWVLKMICDIRGVFGCDFGLFARILRTELRRFRSTIARFSVRFGAILARKTRASTAKHVRPLLAFAGYAQEKICSNMLNVWCVAREKLAKFSMRIARFCVGFRRFLARDTCAASALRSERWFMVAGDDRRHAWRVWM